MGPKPQTVRECFGRRRRVGTAPRDGGCKRGGWCVPAGRGTCVQVGWVRDGGMRKFIRWHRRSSSAARDGQFSRAVCI